MPRKFWSARLSRPISVKNGPMLRTLYDVRVFILDQPEGTQERQSWQKARELLLAAAEHRGVVEAVTRQVEAALFLEARLVFTSRLVLLRFPN
jgi:ABC-type taurine transport system ATPase subunit